LPIHTFSFPVNGDQLFLYSSVALGICLPLSVLTAPTFLSVPFDTVVAVALPFHMATGVGHIVEDYTPAAYKVWAMRLVKLIAILVGTSCSTHFLTSPQLSIVLCLNKH